MSAKEREGERQRYAQMARNSEIVRIMGIARKAGKVEANVVSVCIRRLRGTCECTERTIVVLCGYRKWEKDADRKSSMLLEYLKCAKCANN